MAKVRDLRNYYKSLSKSFNGKSPEKIPTFLTSSSASVNRAEIRSINREIKAYVQPKTAKKYSTVPRHIRSFEWYKISSREIQEKVSKIYFHQNINK